MEEKKITDTLDAKIITILSDYLEHDADGFSEAMLDIKQSLYELILKEVVGEDDETVSYEEYQKMSNTEQLKYGKEPLYSIHRNQLREEQRKVLSEIFE